MSDLLSSRWQVFLIMLSLIISIMLGENTDCFTVLQAMGSLRNMCQKTYNISCVVCYFSVGGTAHAWLVLWLKEPTDTL